MKFKAVFKYLMFLIIPAISTALCVIFRIAQGERTEEIAVGVMIGIVLNLIYAIVLLVAERKTGKTEK